MREILFRGKREDNGEWICGMPCATEQSGIYAIQTLQGGIFDIIPETVGQFTGCSDANGKPIFEGDILRDISTYLAHLYYVEDGSETKEQAERYRCSGDVAEVRFSTDEIGSCGCCYEEFQGSGFKADFIKFSKSEVIGNVHDNPELLKQKEE